MWGVRTAAAWLLAVAFIVTACDAGAEPLEAGPEQARWLLFSSSDVWRGRLQPRRRAVGAVRPRKALCSR
jgi:hypothetical protein